MAEINAKVESFKLQNEIPKVIIVDCSTIDRIGDLKAYLEDFPRAIIDHHESGDNVERIALPGACPCYYDKKAPSTTFMIYKLISTMGLQPTREEAEWLFFGLCTDTGFFRHVESNAEVFDVAAALIRCGAVAKTAFAAMHDGKTLNSRKVLGNVLSRAESLFDGKLILSTEEYTDFCQLGGDDHDSDSTYRLFMTIAGVEAVAILRQETPEICSLGFRSRSWVDVGSIAKAFGGGGHKNAAGFHTSGKISEVRPKIIKVFEDAFKAGKPI